MALSPSDVQDLDYSVKRMGSVSTVFNMRSEAALDAKFSMFAELMDLYIKGCEQALKDNVDFKNSGIVLDTEDTARVQDLVGKIFQSGGSPKE